jgi:hypothetical protein
MKVSFFPLAVAALAVGLSNVHAQENHQVLEVTPDPQSLGGIEAVLSRYAAPIPAIPQEGDTYLSVIKRECPGVSDAYLLEAPQQLAELNMLPPSKLNDSVTLLDKARIFIPYCIGHDLTKHEVQPGESLWTIFEKQRDTPGKLTDWKQFTTDVKTLNKGTSSENHDLKVGQELLLPNTTLSVPIQTESVQPALDELRLKGVRDAVKAAPNWGSIQADVMNDSCERSVHSYQLAEEGFERISNILTLNAYIDSKSNGWERANATTPLIGIFDTGIDGISTPTMKNGRRKLSASVSEKDLDVLPTYDKKYHGSGVMSVALGGHLYAQLNPLYSLVDAVSYRIIDELCERPRQGEDPTCQFVGRDDRLTFALEAARKKTDVAVVNLSVAFPREIRGFENFVGTSQPYVIVVAAGNAGLVIDDANPTHPAMLGGNDISNVITVAALGGDDELMETSNRSSKYVDLAAWGCGVPVLEFSSDLGRFLVNARSGTSYAAPQVSFAAAMLSKEQRSDGSGISSVEIKKRLIFSSDINPRLWKDVRHGRVLDIEKALSVYADVVEFSSGKTVRGRVHFDDDQNDQVFLCPDVQMSREAIRKLTRLSEIPSEAGAKRFFLYSDDISVADKTQSKIDVNWCDAISPKMSITDVFSDKTIDFDPTDVKDVVFASMPYWK